MATHPADPLGPLPESVYGNILGATPRMQRLFRLIQKVAPSESTVLLTGESGTGKELFARALHLQSKRAAAAFVPVNCGALPEGLIESELFGYAKGAFTGAQTVRRGLIEEAEGGTLFLDEIGDTPLSTQVKLLRFLESNEVRRLGENQVRIVDARVIAATNRELSELVTKKSFRQDFYYRLNVVNLEIPPLRERIDDVPLLAGYFLDRYAKEAGRNDLRFSPEAQALLLQYDYPGNVRELENAVRRAVTLGEGVMVLPSDLPAVFSRPRMLEVGEAREPSATAGLWKTSRVSTSSAC